MYDDEFNGQGGSYVIDPKTGKRKLQERTEEATEVVIETTTPAISAPANDSSATAAKTQE